MNKAYLLALLTVLFWSTSATAFKLSLKYLDVPQLLFYASLVSTVVIALILLIQGRFKEAFTLERQDYINSFFLGFINPFIYYLMIFKAYDLLPAQIAQSVNYTWAIMLTLLSVPLLKHPFGKIDFIAMLICYTGAVIVSTHGDISGFKTLSLNGLILALGSTVVWALYWILNVRMPRDPIIGLFLNFLFSLPLTAISCLWFSSITDISLKGFAGAVWVGCFEFGFTFVIWLTALKLSNNTGKIVNLIFLTPFISLIFIRFFLNETVFISTFIGLAFIVSGLLLQKTAG
ncbi:MAG: DMT family transporter [Desulfamplus sp.]|nr:DMT family transporter [Desulfamplus sp.]MBF0412446.1 DMT family transporter [Desulfamplus sp.]